MRYVQHQQSTTWPACLLVCFLFAAFAVGRHLIQPVAVAQSGPFEDRPSSAPYLGPYRVSFGRMAHPGRPVDERLSTWQAQRRTARGKDSDTLTQDTARDTSRESDSKRSGGRYEVESESAPPKHCRVSTQARQTEAG